MILQMLSHRLERFVGHVGAGLGRFGVGQRLALLAESEPANKEGRQASGTKLQRGPSALRPMLPPT
jgi:hypothetical protein